MKDLKISPVEIDDEGQFRCELTYLEPTENCDSIHELKFRTLREYPLFNMIKGVEQ